jgi:hypothetical protein
MDIELINHNDPKKFNAGIRDEKFSKTMKRFYQKCGIWHLKMFQQKKKCKVKFGGHSRR